MKAALPVDACGQYIKYRFVDRIPYEPTELMMRGKLFEHHVLGSTRDGETPELKKLKRGGESKSEKDLMELVTYAKVILDEIGFNPSGGHVQVEIITDDGEEGHIDCIAPDFQKPSRNAIYDLKYTETRYDDRWNGWADFDNKGDEKLQARHYIYLYAKKHGVFLPYYFIVFGKSFWCKIIKVVVTNASMAAHEVVVNTTRDKLARWEQEGWPALPEFIKCGDCQYNTICKFVATKPTVEYFEI